VGHYGEVNELPDLYLEKTSALLTSNLVAPGTALAQSCLKTVIAAA
jgi:hypothetical protein